MQFLPGRIKPIPPTEKTITEGTTLVTQIGSGRERHNGKVCNETGTILWQYQLRESNSRWTLRNPFCKRDFVIADTQGSGELTIRRLSFTPPIFQMIVEGHEIGRIRMTSLFRSRYCVWLGGNDKWKFKMPLFTIAFFGNSDVETGIWVVVGPSEKQWNILIKPGVEPWPLAAALAFIHHERYFYS